MCRAAERRQLPGSAFTSNHKDRLLRHGAVNQGVTSADVEPDLARVRRWIENNAASAAWGQLDERWLTVVDHARDVVAAANAGRARPGYERTAAYVILKLAEVVKPREVVETALAMFMMQELEPRRLRSDAAPLRDRQALAGHTPGIPPDRCFGGPGLWKNAPHLVAITASIQVGGREPIRDRASQHPCRVVH